MSSAVQMRRPAGLTRILEDLAGTLQVRCGDVDCCAVGEVVNQSEIWTETWAARLREGDAVTVVYWPKNPRRSVVYGTGDFRVVDERGQAIPV